MEGRHGKATVTTQLLAFKKKSGKSFDEIAEETGLTNVYVAQLLRRQAQLKPETAPKLRAALPDLPDHLLEEMMAPPMRSHDPHLIQEPAIYRLNEAVMHFGESIKEIINEKFGDGITSLIDLLCSMKKFKDKDLNVRGLANIDNIYLCWVSQRLSYPLSRSLSFQVATTKNSLATMISI
ncbi:hypothetical protein Syun_006905 [Stephania yunnanensis]|uniref:Cyanate lyase C-terminal domain-containing protein n=1 Tax=Stephania yunnanensis TaxID=152371 RepID=A0AAP0KZ75_9MAGN